MQRCYIYFQGSFLPFQDELGTVEVQKRRTTPMLAGPSLANLSRDPKTSQLWSRTTTPDGFDAMLFAPQAAECTEAAHTCQTDWNHLRTTTLLCHQACIPQGAWLMLFASHDVIIKYGAISSISQKRWSCKQRVLCDALKPTMKYKYKVFSCQRVLRFQYIQI